MKQNVAVDIDHETFSINIPALSLSGIGGKIPPDFGRTERNLRSHILSKRDSKKESSGYNSNKHEVEVKCGISTTGQTASVHKPPAINYDSFLPVATVQAY